MATDDVDSLIVSWWYFIDSSFLELGGEKISQLQAKNLWWIHISQKTENIL